MRLFSYRLSQFYSHFYVDCYNPLSCKMPTLTTIPNENNHMFFFLLNKSENNHIEKTRSKACDAILIIFTLYVLQQSLSFYLFIFFLVFGLEFFITCISQLINESERNDST